jgi:hypothetical protein
LRSTLSVSGRNVPINSTQTYIQSLLDGMILPYALPSLAAYITPPDPNVEAEVPTAYVWPSDGDESRDPAKGGTIPRNTGPGTPSGWKNIDHSIDVWLVWFAQDDDPLSDTAFPAIVDAVMYKLRTSPERPLVVDPVTEQQSWLLDIGEKMTYRITLRSLMDQSYNRYDGLVNVQVTEVLQLRMRSPQRRLIRVGPALCTSQTART